MNTVVNKQNGKKLFTKTFTITYGFIVLLVSLFPFLLVPKDAIAQNNQLVLSHTSRLTLPILGNATLVSQRSDDGIEKKNILVSDSLSSTKMIVDEEGGVVEAPSYYPYGQEREKLESILTNKYYTSQRKVTDASSLYNYSARYYNPDIGIFIQPDSKQGPTRYTYVSGNPIMMNDPTGNAPCNAYKYGNLWHFLHICQWDDDWTRLEQEDQALQQQEAEQAHQEEENERWMGGGLNPLKGLIASVNEYGMNYGDINDPSLTASAREGSGGVATLAMAGAILAGGMAKGGAVVRLSSAMEERGVVTQILYQQNRGDLNPVGIHFATSLYRRGQGATSLLGPLKILLINHNSGTNTFSHEMVHYRRHFGLGKVLRILFNRIFDRRMDRFEYALAEIEAESISQRQFLTVYRAYEGGLSAAEKEYYYREYLNSRSILASSVAEAQRAYGQMINSGYVNSFISGRLKDYPDAVSFLTPLQDKRGLWLPLGGSK